MMTEESLPSARPMPEGAILAVWVIYQRPKDYPEGYVLRCQWAMKGTPGFKADTIAWYAASPDELRAILPPGLECLGRMADDDGAILETWI